MVTLSYSKMFVISNSFTISKVCEIPFSSVNKYQVSIHASEELNAYLLVIKGAPERVIEMCSTYFENDKEAVLDPVKRKELLRSVLKLGYMGERVLAFADLLLPHSEYKPGFRFTSDQPNFPLTKLRFVGLMSMLDPPRSSVPEAVEKCRTAGIRVVMVTGDHPVTAVAIAKKVGIISPNNETLYDIAMKRNISTTKISSIEQSSCAACVITGSDLRKMTEKDLDNLIIAFKEIVFARTSPQQKLQIVEAFQRSGAVVAVTGDGVNDSPALKKADIGVAMGIAGSDVSKEAADMIILDDNFASIIRGIEEGRLIFDNLKKTIAFTLTSTTPEIMPFILFATIGIPSALTVMGVLVINMVTDIWPAISLAYERPESDIMQRTPRNLKKDVLVNGKLLCFSYLQVGLIQTFAAFATYFFVMAQHGFFYDRLLGIRYEWDSEFINDLVDSYGYEWTYRERKILEKKGCTAYFLSIVYTQVADSLICKTRRLSIIHQGMSNWSLNMGIVFQFVMAYFCIYTPGVNTVLLFEPLAWYDILPTLPFALYIILFDEIRRCIIRHRPNGWIYQETYY